MKTAQIFELLKQAEEFKPIAEAILDIVESYRPQISELVDMLAIGIAQKNTDIFNFYVSKGFSRDEAMTLIAIQMGQLERMVLASQKGRE